MFGDHFYHATMRKSVAVFGTLFNNLRVIRKAADGSVLNQVRVPLAYGPKQKFLARLDQETGFDATMAIKLPRMAFEMTSLTIDTTQKMPKRNKIVELHASDVTKKKTIKHWTSYDIGMSLYIMVKNQDDGLQIVEQILPYFQPDYTLTIKDMTDMGIARDVPIILNSVSYEDNYRGEYGERRAIIYTLAFTTKFYLYGPVTSQKVIKTVQVDQYTDIQDNAPKREQRYTVAPKPFTADADDDFGFNETTSFFQDAKNFDSESGTDK